MSRLWNTMQKDVKIPTRGRDSPEGGTAHEREREWISGAMGGQGDNQEAG